jgi:aspartate kinase
MAHNDKPAVGGLVWNDHLAMISITGAPSHRDVSGMLLSALSEQGINMELVVHLADLAGHDAIVLGINRHDLDGAQAVIERLRGEIEGVAITSDPDVALVSLFGLDLREQHGVASTMYEALHSHHIKIRAISTSLSTISCLIEAQGLDAAIQVLREAFTLP